MKYSILLILTIFGSICNNVYSQTRNEKVDLFFKAFESKNIEIIELYSDDVLKIWAEDYGKDTVYSNILYGLRELNIGQRNYDKAIERNIELIEVNKKIYGERNELYIYSVATQADLYYEVQDYRNALSFYKISSTNYPNLLGSLHKETIRHKMQYAFCLFMNGFAELAAAQYVEIINSPEIFNILSEVQKDEVIDLCGSAYFRLNDFDNAIKFKLQAAKRYQRNKSFEESPSYNNCLQKLAKSYYNISNYKESLRYYSQCDSFYKKTLSLENYILHCETYRDAAHFSNNHKACIKINDNLLQLINQGKKCA